MIEKEKEEVAGESEIVSERAGITTVRSGTNHRSARSHRRLVPQQHGAAALKE